MYLGTGGWHSVCSFTIIQFLGQKTQIDWPVSAINGRSSRRPCQPTVESSGNSPGSSAFGKSRQTPDIRNKRKTAQTLAVVVCGSSYAAILLRYRMYPIRAGKDASFITAYDFRRLHPVPADLVCVTGSLPPCMHGVIEKVPIICYRRLRVREATEVVAFMADMIISYGESAKG